MTMYDGREFGEQFDGIMSLAKVGIAAIMVLSVAVPIGVIAIVWWLIRHIRIQ